MLDICVLCSEGDENKVKLLVNYLREKWDVWWFKDIGGGNWDEQTEKAILEAKCVIPVWSKTSIEHGKKVVNEADWAEKMGKVIIPVNIDDVVQPLIFSRLSDVKLNRWNGELNHQGLGDLRKKLEIVLNIKKRNERPYEILLNGVAVKLPCFVRSISSHETQLDPEISLKAMELLQINDAILVSSYDMYLHKNASNKEVKSHKNMLKFLKNMKNKGCFILMDSGKYEASRKEELELSKKQLEKGMRQKVKKEFLWTEAKFKKTLQTVPFTYAC